MRKTKPSRTTAVARQSQQGKYKMTTIDCTLLNASGHVQALPQRYSLVSLAGVGMTVGNVWPAIGGTILVAISNGGPPGVLYEFLVVSFFYFLVAASLAELASAIPSAGGVYHWATVLPGRKWGRPLGFFAGWWNYLGLAMGGASMTAILGNTVVQMYALNHPDFVAETWHVFVVYIICVWLSAALVCVANAAMPFLNKAGIFFILAGFLITTVAVAAMPGHNGRSPHATSEFVWTQWTQSLGYPDGFVFVAGMLNGAYSIGTVDVITHLAEEIPHPERAVPIGMGLQIVMGFLTGFCFLVAIMYAISDLSAVSDAAYPIAEIYRQATGNAAGASALLALLLVNIALCVIGLSITNGRTLWALARDGATPVPKFLSKVHEGLGMPLNATISGAVLVSVLGCIYIGSKTAFNAFIASTILFFSSSYIVCIVPHLIRRCRGREILSYGPFKLRGGNGWVGIVVNAMACSYLMTWFVIYSFPYYLPTSAASMNYSCLIWGGFTVFAGVWWVLSGHKGIGSERQE
ncbi:amino acid/polyamine transporter I [Coniella lustricola]|uniref:Amino acid/polyamine transporter I n=1 Tax=Coniella lustricola TaxID=2025994 RepID=A0A2T3A2N1_9PEZI|nr:amino acid/polyamine transporter I [Coniella lustricola]